jgi:hypothetical protein
VRIYLITHLHLANCSSNHHLLLSFNSVFIPEDRLPVRRFCYFCGRPGPFRARDGFKNALLCRSTESSTPDDPLARPLQGIYSKCPHGQRRYFCCCNFLQRAGTDVQNLPPSKPADGWRALGVIATLEYLCSQRLKLSRPSHVSHRASLMSCCFDL